MTKPRINQTNSLNQLAAGNENISSRQQAIPSTGTKGTRGHRNGRDASGFVFLMIRTAPQTIVNANNVPILVKLSSASIGSNAVMIPTNSPMAIVLFQGVRKVGWTAAKKLRGTR